MDLKLVGMMGETMADLKADLSVIQMAVLLVVKWETSTVVYLAGKKVGWKVGK